MSIRRGLVGISSIAVGVALGQATKLGLIPLSVSLPVLVAAILLHIVLAENGCD
jgi:hypothetical protein